MKPLLRTSFLLGVALSVYLPAKAQLKLGDNPTAIRTDAILELNSANQGLLLPRVLKAQITGSGNLFAAPDGMMVYVKDVGEMAVYVKQNGAWVKSGSNITVNGQSGPTIVLKTDDIAEGTTNLYYTDARARAAISAGLGLSYNNTTGVMTNKLGDVNVTGPITGQVLQYQAGKWVNWTPDLSVFNVWSTTGNTTNVAANFLGTTNLNSINFRTNNVERGRILTDGRWSIGGADSTYSSNAGAALMLKNRMIIESNGPGTNNEIIFTKASTGGVNRIADDNGDFQMQGGNNIPYAFGASQSIIFFGDRNNTSYVPTTATTGTGVFIPSQRTVSVPLGVQAIASQTANLTEWRNSGGTAVSAIDKSGNLGLGTAAPAQTLHVAGTMRLTGNVSTTSTGLLGRDATGDITGVTIGSTSTATATTPFSFATNVLNINNTAALWNANKILSVTVPAISTTDGMVLKSSGSGTALVWATDNGLSALADGKIWIGVGPAMAPTPATLSGDITMTNAGVVTIANGAVTAAKMAQNGATSGQTLNWNGTTWIPQTPITSIGLTMPSIFTVSGSPLTANGTITTSLNTQTANTIFAGPSSGAAAAPTFRALTAADLPSNLATYIQNQNAAAQATSNFWISGTGKTGGSMEVGGTSGSTSGLKFTGLTSATTPATGNNNLLTLDASGNVIYATNPTASLADGKMWVGVGAGAVPTPVTISGDATISNAGVLNINTGAIVTADLAANAVTAAKIANATITTTQLANATASSILTTTAAGVPTWVPSSGFLSSVGMTMPSIFTVTNSPLTANGTIATTLNTQAANTIFAGPSTGAASAPTFRALTATDIPTNMTAYIQNQNAAAQASSNFWVSGSGKTGGTMEVGGASGATSGLKFTGMTNATVPAIGNNNVLTLDASGNVIYAVNPAANNWLITGNTGVAATSFLGTTDDKIMTLKSNSLPFLSFGRRATLGLTQTYPDYTDDNEKVTYVQSALQFQADAANFYKPKMWTNSDGNFRMKGSAAGTDYFEFGSAGTNNAGSFEFIVGDDGDEPIVFKNYNYTTGITAENMRIQNGRVGIGTLGSAPNRKLDVEGDMRMTGNAGTIATKLLGKDNNGDVDSVMISTATTALTMTNNVLAASNTTALWNANQIQGTPVSSTAPTSGQMLQYNGTSWVPVSVGAASTVVTSVTISNASPGTIALGSSNFVRLVSGSGFNSSFTIAKFSAGTYDGQQVTIYNSINGNMTLTNLGGGAGQINTMGSTSNTNGIGMVILTWSAADNTWLMTSLVQ